MAPSNPVRLVDADGNPITGSNPLPVTGGSDGGGDGEATAANQVAGNASLATIASAVKAEDAGHNSGDPGIAVLAVRQDNAAALADTDGDYIPLIVDANGRLYVALDSLPALAAGTNNIGDVDIASIAAGETHIGNVGSSDDVITLVFSVNTAIYAANEVLADTQELANVARAAGRVVILKSITLLDKADQKAALTFVFLDANESLGAENGAPTITDANAEAVLGCVNIVAGDYVDLGGCSVATKECALELKAAAETTSLWVAILNGAGTPTYGANDLIAKFGFLRS
jgi:hypothetical protein